MSSVIDMLEQRIIELGRKMEQLRGENESFRQAAEAGIEARESSQEAMVAVESLKQENKRLRQRLEDVDNRLGSVLEGIDKLGDGGKG